MGPFQQFGVFAPMVETYEALIRYPVVALFVGYNCKTGLATLGEALEGRRPRSQALVGVGFTALNLVFAWVLYVAFQLRSAEVTGQAAVDAAAQRLDGTPALVVALAWVPGWTMVVIAAVLSVGVMLVAGRAGPGAAHVCSRATTGSGAAGAMRACCCHPRRAGHVRAMLVRADRNEDV